MCRYETLDEDGVVLDPSAIFNPCFMPNANLHHSTRVVKIDVYYTIRPFKRNPSTKVD